jgi:hypothetical protein
MSYFADKKRLFQYIKFQHSRTNLITNLVADIDKKIHPFPSEVHRATIMYLLLGSYISLLKDIVKFMRQPTFTLPNLMIRISDMDRQHQNDLRSLLNEYSEILQDEVKNKLKVIKEVLYLKLSSK